MPGGVSKAGQTTFRIHMPTGTVRYALGVHPVSRSAPERVLARARGVELLLGLGYSWRIPALASIGTRLIPS